MFFLQKTPVEFFGLPFDDDTLHDAPFQGSNGILTACKLTLHSIGQGRIYLDHKDLASKLPEREVKKKFLMELSKLDPENKQRCFDEIVSALKEGGEGLKHIRDRLIKGVWNKIIEDTARNKNALITIETKRHREEFKKEGKYSDARLLP